jgi:hypothetical protein
VPGCGESGSEVSIASSRDWFGERYANPAWRSDLLSMLFGLPRISTAPIVVKERDSAATRAEILKLIPHGTSLGRAESLLVESGFSKMTDSGTWPAAAPNTAPTPTGGIVQDSPYVTYAIESPVDRCVSRTWYVQLHHKAGAVDDIKVTAGGLTGP